MTAASRSLATALWRARFASGLLPLSYTTTRDATQSPGASPAANRPPVSNEGQSSRPSLSQTRDGPVLNEGQ
jgi:hypothetical protein